MDVSLGILAAGLDLADVRALAGDGLGQVREHAGPVVDQDVELDGVGRTALAGPRHLDAALRPLYVGRRWVHDDRHEMLVVNWQAPAARPFYTATPADPQRVTQRRRYRTDGRHLVDISDQVSFHARGSGAEAVRQGDRGDLAGTVGVTVEADEDLDAAIELMGVATRELQLGRCGGEGTMFEGREIAAQLVQAYQRDLLG